MITYKYFCSAKIKITWLLILELPDMFQDAEWIVFFSPYSDKSTIALKSYGLRLNMFNFDDKQLQATVLQKPCKYVLGTYLWYQVVFM